MSGGKLLIYYSVVFPRFASELSRFARQDSALATSFKRRYELWLAVHSLLFHHDETERDVKTEQAALDVLEREERCRIANLAAIVAAQDIKAGATTVVEIDA